MYIIETKGLTFSYHKEKPLENPVLQEIDFKVKQGEYVAIIGHNGSGKSTLARHFNALLLPDEGEVLIKGVSTKETGEVYHIRQCVGMVFQNPDNQIVATTVEEDVAFGPENLGLPPPEILQRVEEALRLVGMLELRHHAPHLLSGGQKQRLAIAGIIAMRPECLVLDEPTAMLDPRGRAEVLELIERLNKEEGITVIYITHFMEEVRDVTRLVVMKSGLVVLEGSPRRVFSRQRFLKTLGLDVPPVTELASCLRAEGLDIPIDILKVEELVEQLCL